MESKDSTVIDEEALVKSIEPVASQLATVIVQQIIAFIDSLTGLEYEVRKAVAEHPFKMFEKAKEFLLKAEVACSSKNINLFEESIILSAIYLRSALDATVGALAMWFLERVEKRFATLFPKGFITSKGYAILLSNLDFSALTKMAVLMNDLEALNVFEEFRRKYNRIVADNLIFQLRNAIVHGRPYVVNMEQCSIIAPLTKSKSQITISEFKDYFRKCEDYFKDLRQLLGKS